MEAIIVADRQGQELAPLNSQYRPALLPLLGKPIIQHAIEQCQRSGVKDIWLVVNENAQSIRKIIGDGEQWSIKVHYVYLKDGETYAQAISHCGHQLTFPTWCMRGDIVYKAWLETIDMHSLSPELSIANSLMMSGDDLELLNHLEWQNLVNHSKLCEVDFYPLDTLSQVHEVFTKRSLNVQNDTEIDFGIALNNTTHLGEGSSVYLKSLAKGHVYVAKHASISPSASLRGSCYVGENVLVDDHAEITNSVIFDNVLIGKGVTVDNAIVFGRWLYRTDLNTCLYIEDELIINLVANPYQTPWTERLTALFIFFFVLPLGAALSLINMSKGKAIFILRDADLNCAPKPGSISNTGRTQVRTLNSGFFIMRQLPLLYRVFKGELRLFGRDPFINKTDLACCSHVRDLPSGVFSRAQFLAQQHGVQSLYELQELEHQDTKFSGWYESIVQYISHSREKV